MPNSLNWLFEERWYKIDPKEILLQAFQVVLLQTVIQLDTKDRF